MLQIYEAIFMDRYKIRSFFCKIHTLETAEFSLCLLDSVKNKLFGLMVAIIHQIFLIL